MENSARFDVMVVGGGPAGIGAAIAAGRMGKKVGLVERHAILGGMGTSALVNNFCPAHWDGERLIIGGIFAELRQRLIARRALYVTGSMEPYAPDAFVEEASAMCAAAQVQLFLSNAIESIDFSGSAPTAVTLSTGERLSAKTIVDATGDALVAQQAGVPTTFGRPSDGAVMPLTFCYMMGPVSLDAVRQNLPDVIQRDWQSGEELVVISTHSRVNAWLAEARARGEVSIPRDSVSAIMSVPGRREYVTVNFGRVDIADPTDSAQLAAAEVTGRRQIEEGVRFFRKYLPGFEQVEVVEVARQIGVRESRQIKGLYTLTADDVLNCRQFSDVIAQCHYPIDIHEPGSDRTTMKWLKKGTHYDIPWRCLVPSVGPANLIVAGRCISATHEAMSSFRVSPSVMAIGEAAGVTAAMAADGQVAIREVAAEAVLGRLRETGGILS